MEGYNITKEIDDLKKNIDGIFLITNGIIVSFMQAGFTCLEVGAVRTKNSTNIVMKNLLDMFICAIVYYLIGYSLAYGHGSSFMGLTNWAGYGLQNSVTPHWFFQFVFAATAATILSGAVAERCNFVAYISYNAVISGFVYPVVSHWVWYEDGWLMTMGFRDYAGSGAVHALAGACSLVAATLLGPRIGRFEEGKPIEILGHSLPLVGIGALLLVSGFLGFNGGSLGHASQPGDSELIGRAVVNTIMGGGGSGAVCVILGRFGFFGDSQWPFTITLNGILVGMVSVCSGADSFSFCLAFLTGALACPVYLSIHYLMIRFKVDDPLDAVAVHLGGGMWGVIATPILAQGGIAYERSVKSLEVLGINIIGLIAIIAWSIATSLVLFGVLKYTGFLRITMEEELIGLDLSKHGEVSYPRAAWNWSFRNRVNVKEGSMRKQNNSNKSQDSEYYNSAFEMDNKSNIGK